MKTPIPGWLTLAMPLLLTGCPDGGGGGGIGEGTAAPSIVYSSNQGSNDVSGYTINTTTGALTAVAGSPFPAGTTPSAVTVSPNGSFAYVANSGSSNVSAYGIDPATGVLVTVAGSPFPAGTTPNAVTVSPNGLLAYVANGGSNNVSAYTINTTTGVLTAVAGSPFATGTTPSAVTVSPNGVFLFVTNGGSNNVSAYTINTTTGALAPVPGSPFPAGTTPSAVTVSPNGSFAYVTNQGSNDVSAYTIDTVTGVLTALGGGTGNPFAAGTTPVGITITPNGSFVYVANSGSNNISAYTLNVGTGALTALAGGTGNPFPAGTSPTGITLTPTGSFVYVANSGSNNVSAYSMDAGTGALTALAGGTGNPFGAGTLPSGVATPGRP